MTMEKKTWKLNFKILCLLCIPLGTQDEMGKCRLWTSRDRKLRDQFPNKQYPETTPKESARARWFHRGILADPRPDNPMFPKLFQNITS